jgi:2-amino-4-hydroxy-6-hydroxymethyldihydropteridine diphosphokinase
VNAPLSTAYIGLGSNLGDSQQHVRDAVEALGRLPGTRVLARSRLYRTPPWGVLDQPPFVNAVAAVETSLEPRPLLDALLRIERDFGRIRDGSRWGPRILDMDLLLHDDNVLSDPDLTLPHPHIGQRAFVLLPLADLAPDLDIPGQGRVADLLAAIDVDGCEALP